MNSTRWLIANALGRTVHTTGMDRILFAAAGKRGALTVLTYHRIAEEDEYPELDPSLISATPNGFGCQLDYLAKHFNFISGAQLLASMAGEQTLPSAPLLVTFDDGYVDFEKNAWPQLRRRSIPAVQFITTHAVETGEAFWWDKLHNLLGSLGNRSIVDMDGVARPASQNSTKKHLKARLKSTQPEKAAAWLEARCQEAGIVTRERSALSWESLKRLNSEGLEVCPHTRTHPIITHLGAEDISREISESHRELEQHLDSVLPMFAYPSGYVDERARDLCSRTSVQVAFTTRFGVNGLDNCDRWMMRRINVSSKAQAATLGLQAALANLGFSRFRALKAPVVAV